MKIIKLDGFCYIINIKEHIDLKNRLLNYIDEMPNSTRVGKDEFILKTDWHLPKDFKRHYLDLFYELINPYLIEFSKINYSNKFEITNGWFQQYGYNNYHGWHNHPNSNFTCVYYLELPNINLKTQLFDIYSKKIIENINCIEGDVLIFPAYILHRSKPNVNNKRKTIISFNLDLIDVNNDKLNNDIEK